MAAKPFDELRLVVETDAGGAFYIRDLSSGASSSFTVPSLSKQDIQLMSFKMAGSRSDTRARFSTDEDRKYFKEIGTELFERLFEGDVGKAYRNALEAANRHNGVVRVMLDLTRAEPLMDYPWEFLFDPHEGAYLARLSNATFARYFDCRRQTQLPPKKIQLPLRILVVSANPEGLPKLRVDAEVASLRNAAHEMRSIKVDVQTNLTLSALNDHLDEAGRDCYDVIHFIGHGGYNPDSKTGVLSFPNDLDGIDDVNPDRFADVVRNRGVPLIVLNACDGARTDITDPFSGVAVNLLRARVPAVIAMQFAITDSAAIDFSRAFYVGVAKGLPVDLAVSRARARVSLGQDTLEWATPVLFLQAGASPELFEVADSSAAEKDERNARVSDPASPSSSRRATPAADGAEPQATTGGHESTAREQPKQAAESRFVGSHTEGATAPSSAQPTSSTAQGATLFTASGEPYPETLLRKFNWGALLSGCLWTFFNADSRLRLIGVACFLTFMPYPIFSLYLGFQGNRIAARNRDFKSIDQFNRVQRAWSISGAIVVAVFLGYLAAMQNIQQSYPYRY